MRYRIELTPVWVLCLIIGVLPLQLRAQETAAQIALSRESVDLRYIQSQPSKGTEVQFGLFWDENRDLVASGRYYLEADALRFDRLSLKFGPVGYAAMLSAENSDVFSIAIAAEARFELLRRPGVEIVGEVAYAPDILTFGTANKLWDVTARVQLPLADRITGFAGYRQFQIDLLEGTNELEEGFHLGIRYQF
jgi:YfaZ precursor